MNSDTVSNPALRRSIRRGIHWPYAIVLRLTVMLISPAFVLWSDLKNHNVEVKKWSLILFVTFVGSVITIEPAFRGADGAKLWLKVYTTYSWMDFGLFMDGLWGILVFDPPDYAQGDVYIHVLSYLLGGMLDLPGLFFVVVAFVYGYFFSSSIFKIFSYLPKGKLPILFYGFAVVFIFWKNVEAFQAVRTWTGMWILFYGVLSYFEKKEKKYLLVMSLPPLFHFSFFIMMIPAWIVVLFKVPHRYRIFALVFFMSFLFTASHGFIDRHLSVNPLGEGRVSAYSVEDVEEHYSIAKYQQSTWYLQLKKLGVQTWARDVLIFTVILTGIYFTRMSLLERNMFSVGILTVSLSNVGILLYALHNRAGEIGGLFVLGAFVLFLIREIREHRNLRFNSIQWPLFWFSFVLLTPFLIYKAATLIYFVSLFVLVFPFVPWFYPDMNISIREFLGLVLGR